MSYPIDIRPAVTVTAQPRMKEAATEESFPHPPPDCVNGVGHQASSNSHCPAQNEGSSHGGVLSSDQDWHQGVEETEVHATVDEDTDSGDGEASVQALDTI